MIARPRRLLVVNPNTNKTVTRWLADEVRRIAGSAYEIVAINADSGLAAIEKPSDIEAAARSVASEVARHGDALGAIVAAFGDPGLEAARALGLMPVVGLGESGIRAAAASCRRFSVVTLGSAMREPILAKVGAMGLADRLVEVRVLERSISQMITHREAGREETIAAVRACENGAVLLGGAPFAGLAQGVSIETGRIVLDGVEACVAALTGALDDGP
jgi:allantoin racemase